MNAVPIPTRQQLPQQGSPPRYDAGALTGELAKMLALVAPSSMSADQQTLWLASAVDALEGIRAEEVAHVSAEVRRAITRHNQIVPEIAKLVAGRRERSSRYIDVTPVAPLPELPKQPSPPLSAKEIAGMPKWLQDAGLRVGFLRRDNGRLVDTSEA